MVGRGLEPSVAGTEVFIVGEALLVGQTTAAGTLKGGPNLRTFEQGNKGCTRHYLNSRTTGNTCSRVRPVLRQPMEWGEF